MTRSATPLHAGERRSEPIDRGDVELAIAGHGSHETILRSLAAELRIDRHVIFLGTLAQDQLAQLLQVSDIFAIMSTSETQSMVLLQAMASGIPVVAADTTALPEFVSRSNGLLAKPHDPAQVARALKDLLVSPEWRQQLGSGGRQSAEAYNVRTITDAWESLYQSVLNGSASG